MYKMAHGASCNTVTMIIVQKTVKLEIQHHFFITQNNSELYFSVLSEAGSQSRSMQHVSKPDVPSQLHYGSLLGSILVPNPL